MWRPRLVQVDGWCLWTQHDDGAEPDSDTDSVVYAWEEPSHGVAVNRVDHNHDDPPFPEVRQAVLLEIIPNIVLSESASSMSDSEGPSEDVGPSEAGSFHDDESGVDGARSAIPFARGGSFARGFSPVGWCQFVGRDVGPSVHHEVGAAVHARKLSNRHEDSSGGDLCRRTHP